MSLEDMRRELEKAREALTAADLYLARHAEMNAALHCSERVMYSPLRSKVQAAVYGIDHALARTADEPCEITADGWCKTHSTTSGPAYCDREPETTERQIE